MCHPSRRFTVLLTAYVCLLEKYIYIYINIESLLGGWYFHYNAWNDNTIVERGNSNIVIRGMVKGSKQNTKSRLNSGKTLSLPLFSLHVHFPSFVPSFSLSLSLFAFIVFTRTSFRDNVAQQRCVFANAVRFRVVFFSQEYRISLLSALSHLEIESSPLSPDGDLFWRNLYRLRSSGNATLRGTAPPPSSSSPSSWQLYNEISRVGPPDRFLPRKRLIRLRRSGEKIVDKNDIPLSGRLLRALALLSSPS